MFRVLMWCAVVTLALAGVAQGDVLNIAFGQPGYASMVRDVKLRGDGGLQDWNLGNGSGDSNRFYANYLADGVTPSGRLNTFVQWFDVSSIPAGSTINSATLTEVIGNASANTRTWVGVKLSRLQPGKDWVEGVGQAPATDGSVTWINRITHPTTPTPWDSPGALAGTDIDLGTTQTFDVVGAADAVSPTVVVRDITSWVQGWVNTPASNAGMLWWAGGCDDSNSGNRYFRFGTKEDGTGVIGEGGKAPSLLVEYIPEPATLILLSLGLMGLLRRR